MAEQVPEEQVDRAVFGHQAAEELEAEGGEVEHRVGDPFDLLSLGLGDPLGHPARDGRARVDPPSADEFDDPMPTAAGFDHPTTDIHADLPEHAEDVPLSDRCVGTDDEVGSAQGVEVRRVIGHEERAVEQLTQELGGPGRIDLVDGVGGLGGGQVMGLRADAADPVRQGRHLLDAAARRRTTRTRAAPGPGSTSARRRPARRGRSRSCRGPRVG